MEQYRQCAATGRYATGALKTGWEAEDVDATGTALLRAVVDVCESAREFKSDCEVD